MNLKTITCHSEGPPEESPGLPSEQASNLSAGLQADDGQQKDPYEPLVCSAARGIGRTAAVLLAAVIIERDAQIGGGIDRIAEIEFVAVDAAAIVLDNRKVEMDPYVAQRTAVEVAGVAQKRALFDELFGRAGREGVEDEIIARFIRHVGVVEPHLPAWLQGIIRHAHDHGAFPIRFPADIAIIGGVDGHDAGIGIAEDIDALVRAALGIGAAWIGVEQADVAIGGQDEGRAGAGIPLHGDQLLPFGRVSLRPLADTLAPRVTKILHELPQLGDEPP